MPSGRAVHSGRSVPRSRDEKCVQFLQWALPELGLRWAGYRKVRGTVCKRIGRRLKELGLADLDGYRNYLDGHAEEWERLEIFCHIPISRFFRDRAVFVYLGETLLPALVGRARERSDEVLRVLSLGCASGEEVYSLSLLWARRLAQRYPDTRLSIVGLDADETLLKRASAGCYSRGSLRDLPRTWLEWGFEASDDQSCVRGEFRSCVRLEKGDMRRSLPDGLFDLILCRNVAFTYFAPEVQEGVLDQIGAHLHDGAALVIGGHERLPANATGYASPVRGLPVFLWQHAAKAEPSCVRNRRRPSDDDGDVQVRKISDRGDGSGCGWG